MLETLGVAIELDPEVCIKSRINIIFLGIHTSNKIVSKTCLSIFNKTYKGYLKNGVV